jgi:hypothetical protein
MASRLKTGVFAVLPLAGLFLTAPPVVFAKSHAHRCWEEGDSSRSYDEDDLYNDDASSDRSRSGRRPYEENPYDGSRPYDDRGPYPLPDVLGPNASPSGLDTSTLLA